MGWEQIVWTFWYINLGLSRTGNIGQSIEANLYKAHAILDDIFQNFLHDLLLKTHREEKIARANTAAIIVEQLAAKDLTEESAAASPKKPLIIKTEGAVYDDGNVYIVGNPLRTTHEIRCSRCNLPRVLYPPITTGDKLRAPDAQFCKRLPFADQPGHDIHGHPLTEATLKKNARLNKERELLASKSQSQGEPGSSFESPAPSPPPEGGVKTKTPKTIIPNASCSLCKRSVQCSRFAKHLQACMGVAGRASSRTAKLKMEEQANGNQTPPQSRRSTPLPSMKKSPQKRDADEFEEDENEETPKKKVKKVVTKKWKSGKVTVDGKALLKARELAGKEPIEKQMEAEGKSKEASKKETLPPREPSESSRTLSSPS
jgi:hypothetical protein